jgi:hypothetical protein
MDICHSEIIKSRIQINIQLKSSTFWDITPCNPLKVNLRFGETCLHLQGWRIIKQNTGVKSGGNQTIWRYIQEDRTLSNYGGCEYLKFFFFFFFCRRYSPWWTLAPFMIALHWSRTYDFRLQFVSPIVFKSSSSKPSHQIAGLPTRQILWFTCIKR